LLGADRWGLENIRNHDTIPPRGTELFVGLIPWEQGSGGPCRVIARW
jgi:kynurenine formamidase